MESEDVLAAAAEQCRLGGVGPDQSMAAGAHFRAQDDAEHRASRDAVMRLPDAESRQVVLERGHEPPIEISDDEETPADAQAMWPAQRRVAMAVEQGEASSSDSD
eukprot:6845178-Alexandrium_andersonii.AAC.1